MQYLISAIAMKSIFFLMLPRPTHISRLKKGSNNKCFLTISASTQQSQFLLPNFTTPKEVFISSIFFFEANHSFIEYNFYIKQFGDYHSLNFKDHFYRFHGQFNGCYSNINFPSNSLGVRFLPLPDTRVALSHTSIHLPTWPKT